jgi:ACS family hexuronate transporter-like MFS transporter
MNCAYALSSIIAPLATGWLVTVTGTFSVGIILMIGLTLSSALLIIMFQHPDKKHTKHTGSVES